MKREKMRKKVKGRSFLGKKQNALSRDRTRDLAIPTADALLAAPWRLMILTEIGGSLSGC